LFGGFTPGDNGRNYLRTIATDYAAVSFEALITFVWYGVVQQGYFGLGSGEIALFGTPDWSTQVSSVSAFLADTAQLMTFRTQNDINEFAPVPGAPIIGSHRVRMAFDSVARTMTFSVDLNHAGGAFIADLVAPAVDVSTLFGPTGWPTEPACIFFGGDDSVVFKELVVNVAVPPDPPLLQVVKMPPTSLRLTWPNVGSFSLQQNSILGSTHWTSVTNVPFIAGGQAQVTLPANQSSQVFRLIYP